MCDAVVTDLYFMGNKLSLYTVNLGINAGYKRVALD
jgi:hypothetical protein